MAPYKITTSEQTDSFFNCSGVPEIKQSRYVNQVIFYPFIRLAANAFYNKSVSFSRMTSILQQVLLDSKILILCNRDRNHPIYVHTQSTERNFDLFVFHEEIFFPC